MAEAPINFEHSKEDISAKIDSINAAIGNYPDVLIPVIYDPLVLAQRYREESMKLRKFNSGEDFVNF